MNRFQLTMLAAVVLAGCAGGSRVAEPTRYDLGTTPDSATIWRLPLAAIEVQAPSWLSATAMYYRLVYVEPLRRQGYTESRWASPPAELLETVLNRRQAKTDANGSACRLQLVLDELEQRFDDAQTSQVVLEARAVLLPARGSDMLARRSLQIRRPALTADARGGAAAAREAALALAEELATWTNELASGKPAVAERCRT